jgi:hypothetical protein
MVRTLDFQSKNVGSIPSGPIIKINKILHRAIKIKNLTNKKKLNQKINYNFLFVSLISPSFFSNISFSNQLSTNQKKLLLKQSYILFTWIYYLSFIENKKNKKNKIKIFVLPTHKRKFTKTKAPMAHKNWSKEQYLFKFYKIKISFNSFFDEENFLINADSTFLFLILNKKNFPILESNLLFLKFFNLLFFFKDQNYFNFIKQFNTFKSLN